MIHSEGHCENAWLDGAVVESWSPQGDIKRIILAELVKKPVEDGGVYLSLAIRSSIAIGEQDMSLVRKMFDVVEEEKEKSLPGLIFNTKLLCPDCRNFNFDWNRQHGIETRSNRRPSTYCDGECHKPVKLVATFMSLYSSCSSTSDAVDRKAETLEILIDRTPMREYDIFISARFDGSQREQDARDLKDELVKIGLDAHMVKAAAGDDFGDKTHEYLYSMKTMIAFCFDNYGQKTISKYSTYHELKYAYDKDKHIIPVKRCTEWPPKPPPDHDGGYKGIIQNDNVFKRGLKYLDWSNTNWNPAECAKEVQKAMQTRST
jgi:hypothetical protein